MTDFREACCRQHEIAECNRGGFCNFMHLKHPRRSLRRELFEAQQLSLKEKKKKEKDERRSGRSSSPHHHHKEERRTAPEVDQYQLTAADYDESDPKRTKLEESLEYRS